MDGRVVIPLVRTRGVREVSASVDGDGSRKADDGVMLPVVPETRDGIHAWLVIPQVGKV